MKLSQKLALSARKGYISFIDEGLFLRIYNQSAYIINELFDQKLTLSSNVILKLGNRRIVYCAFPKASIQFRFPQAEKTEWGYELHGDFDLTNYQSWFNEAYQQLGNRFNNMTESAKTEQICLNNKQISFLRTWQRGIYPNTVTEGFVESLKQQLAKIKSNSN